MKTVPFQRSLFRNLVLGPTLFGIVIFVVLHFTLQQLNSVTAAQLIGRAISETDASLRAYMHPIEEIADVSLSLGRAGQLSNRSTEEIDAVVSAMLQSVSQISSMHIATDDGQEYMMLIESDGTYYQRQSDPANAGLVTERRWETAPVAGGEPQTRRVESDYDAREREWFGLALSSFEAHPQTDNVHDLLRWTEPYRFFTTQELGITASFAYPQPSGTIEIVAFDILLNDIAQFVEEARLGEEGLMFVLLRPSPDAALSVLTLPTETEDEDRLPMQTGGLTGVPADLMDAFELSSAFETEQPVRFLSGDRAWWGAVARSPLSSEKEIWIVAALPEDEILADIPDIQWIIGAVLGIVILLMVFRAQALSRRYGIPLTALVTQTDRMGRLNFEESDRVQSPIAEIEQLALAQDGMRRSLGALTDMNDQGELARELRRIPPQMSQFTSRGVQVDLVDQPGKPVSGLILFGKSVSRSAPDSAEQSYLVALVEVQLTGIAAAKFAMHLRAMVETLIDRGENLESVFATIQETADKYVIAGTARNIVLSRVDTSRNRAHLLWDGSAHIFRVSGDGVATQWEGNGGNTGDSKGSMRKAELELVPGDCLLICPQSIFDFLNQNRRRLDEEQLIRWLADAGVARKGGIATALTERLSDYVGDGLTRPDIGFVAITRDTQREA